MFKPAVNTYGHITTSVSAVANIFLVDDESAGTIAAALTDIADWTYLKVGIAPQSEVVKVTAISGNAITVTRAIDGTVGLAFPTLTPLQYILSAAAVADIVQENAFVQVQLASSDANIVVVENGPNDFTITLTEPTFLSSSGSIEISGAWPELELDINPDYNGCCS